MNQIEKRAAVGIGGVYAVRMLGLFLLFPVFALHSDEFRGATQMLTGVALGIYGLTQALLQVPMGMLSDRFGRKRIIFVGLSLFCAGSLVAAFSETIYGVIVGRALQGTGAVAAALMALAADLSRDEQRARVNAVIGAGIGVAFALALVLGPVFEAWFGLSGIFLVSAALGVAAIAWTLTLVPSAPVARAPALGASLRGAFAEPDLVRLYAGIFALHAVLAANFMILPTVLEPRLQLDAESHWIFYMVLMPLAFVLMSPALAPGLQRHRAKLVFLAAIALATLAQATWYFSVQAPLFIVSIVLFFAAFMYLEASLPTLVSRTCAACERGGALGVFAAAQFLGVFCGAAGAGFVGEQLGEAFVAPLAAVLLLVWLLGAFGMRAPGTGVSHVIHVGSIKDGEAAHLTRRLSRVRGVLEAVVVPEREIACLKVNRAALDTETLAEIAKR